METPPGKVGVAQPVSMHAHTKRPPPKSRPPHLLDLSNELLHHVFIHIPFESNQLCKLMLVNGQICEYITNNKAQICDDIAQLQFPEQALTYKFANNEIGAGKTGGVFSQECLVDLAKSDGHVNYVFQKMESVLEPGAEGHLTPSMLLTCLHMFEGLHRFDVNTDDKLDSTIFIVSLRGILPWLRLASMKLWEALQKHLITMEARAWIEFFGIRGLEVACENVMVKYDLGPVVNMLDLTKAEYSEKRELASLEFFGEAWKLSKTQNMTWSLAQHNLPGSHALLSVNDPGETTKSATWGSVATASLALKYISGEIIGWDQTKAMKEGLAGLMQRCDAFPVKIEIPIDQGPEQSPPGTVAEVSREVGFQLQASRFNWADFAGRGVRDELGKLEKQVDGGYSILHAALGLLQLANDLKSTGFDSLAAEADLPPYGLFFALQEMWTTELDGIEKHMAERRVTS